VKYRYLVILLSALTIAALFFWSGCTQYGTEPYQPPPNQNPNILSLSNASGAPGDTGIIVDVNLHNVEPMAGAQMRIVYDAGRLQPSDTPFLKPSRASQMDFYAGTFSNPGVITFAMAWFSQKGIIDVGDGPVLQLLFDVKSTAVSGASALSFQNEGSQINALSDTLGTLIFPQLQNATFTVQ
jgi:hypothetical protein